MRPQCHCDIKTYLVPKLAYHSLHVVHFIEMLFNVTLFYMCRCKDFNEPGEAAFYFAAPCPLPSSGFCLRIEFSKLRMAGPN